MVASWQKVVRPLLRSIRQRTVITLRDVEGCTSEEVCEILEISAANQRVLLHRARTAVRGRLEDYFETARRPA